jgi:NADPH-dependent glutamate synthase beta subunit-like oxidoreductase/CO/xanthine dehydrogenase FAD-binding subunit
VKPFKHVNARTVNEAVKLLKNSRGRARLISGGTDLLGSLKDKILPEYPETIINIKTIRNLNYIREGARGLKIGALTRLEDIACSPVIRERYKILADAAESVATPQIRRMGTVGGNLCQDVRCWYYRYPDHIGGQIPCYLKGGKGCYALNAENRYHSLFGGLRAGNPPCSSACPGGVEIPSYLSKVREGNLNEAAVILLASNPIPSITGRVCPHFCEQQCNRAGFDESVSVRDIERFMGDYILEHADELLIPPETDSGKGVAIVGSGPAGLSAAYYLRMSGCRVTVFDRMEEPGGLLTHVIPEYRLPKGVVRRVVQAIQNTGVELRLKVDIGRDVTLNDLKKNFDGVFIATGSWSPVSIGLEGEQESTAFGMQFLMNIHQGIKEAPGKRVLVIGGGNAAVDVAVSALRLGAEAATMACLESLDEMPALPWERRQAVEEGVRLMPSWGPHRILKSGGKVTGMELIRCTSVYNSEGRFAPSCDNTVKETVEADVIMMAVGYATDLHFISPDLPLQITGGLLTVDPETQATNATGVFAGGAVAHGPATVIEAISSGKRAAAAMNLYLGGSGIEAEDKNEKPIASLTTFNNNYLKKTGRLEPLKIPAGQRRIDIEDISGLGLGEAEAEANRCFNCSCVSVNASDIGVALIALDAKVRIGGIEGVRTIPIGEFFGSIRNSLVIDEMVTEIQIPRPPEGARQIFLKYRLREAVDFAIVSLASVIAVKDGYCKGARIALGAVAPVPFRAVAAEQALNGKPINSDTIEAAAEATVRSAIPLSKNAYKIEIIKTLIKRSLVS